MTTMNSRVIDSEISPFFLPSENLVLNMDAHSWKDVLGIVSLIALCPGLTVSCLVLPEAFYRLDTEE